MHEPMNVKKIMPSSLLKFNSVRQTRRKLELTKQKI